VIQDAGVEFVEVPRVGPSAGRNAAAAKARGHLLYFIDSDALPAANDLLARLVEVAAGLRRFGAAGGPVLLLPAQRRNPIAIADHLACWFLWHARRPAGPTDFQPSVNLLMPRNAFQAIGGFDETLRVLEDFDVALKLRGAGLPIYFHPALAVFHRARGSLWTSWRHSWYWGAPAREAYYARVALDRYPHAGSRARFWRHFPALLGQRLRIVLRIGWRLSWREVLVCLPFLVATIFVWAVAVCVGKGQPTGD
jgi:GT2 family glycosyltransferase